MVKELRDDIPPLFSTEQLSPQIGDELIQYHTNNNRKDGFDQIQYRTTRFNNVLRLMHIPHPLPFVLLCGCIRDNWEKLKHICTNDHSQIKPQKHNDRRIYIFRDYDAGRVVVMEKERFPNDVKLHLSLSHGAVYLVDADVSACFPSIYIHAIPWALIGQSKAKNSRSKKEWFNQLDIYQRYLKRNETQGVPVGPASSNIMNEVILGRVDEELAKKDYHFLRSIDDYKCFCKTREQAEMFVRDLERELSKYLLLLNAKKVEIAPLPSFSKSSWVTEISSRLPFQKKASERAIVDYLDQALHLQFKHPEGSVVKYAARALVSKLTPKTAPLYCLYVNQLAFHYPVVLPILCEVVKRFEITQNTIKAEDILTILNRQIDYLRSDMICWTLYLLSLVKGQLPEEIAKKIVKTGDCMSMATLLAISQHENAVIEYIKKLDLNDAYELDRNWILIHELKILGMLQKTDFEMYAEASGINVLVQSNVSFLIKNGIRIDEKEDDE
jgi:hypothetical protein